MTALLVHYISIVDAWSINPYQHCAHRCQYCIAGSQGESVPWYDAGELLPALRTGLAQVPAGAEVFIGGMADAYPPVERENGLTRLIIEELMQQHRAFCINTKSDLVCREIDLLSRYDGHCDVCLSLCTLDEAALSVLEPGAPAAAQRLKALHLLHDAGIDIMIDAAPWIPGISDAEALIAILPGKARIQFGALDLCYCGGSISLLGQRYVQEQIDAAYLRERKRVGGHARVIWKDPLSQLL